MHSYNLILETFFQFFYYLLKFFFSIELVIYLSEKSIPLILSIFSKLKMDPVDKFMYNIF